MATSPYQMEKVIIIKAELEATTDMEGPAEVGVPTISPEVRVTAIQVTAHGIKVAGGVISHLRLKRKRLIRRAMLMMNGIAGITHRTAGEIRGQRTAVNRDGVPIIIPIIPKIRIIKMDLSGKSRATAKPAIGIVAVREDGERAIVNGTMTGETKPIPISIRRSGAKRP